MSHDRFVSNAFSELQEANRSPIYGYQHLPVMTLEDATEKIISLVPNIVEYVSKAKTNCNRSSTLLTSDESAAIYLYSMPIPFFSRLNETLRAENRHALKPWFAFLKLFVTALEKLPSTKKTVWRGVAGDVGSIFAVDDVHIWWSVNSCSMDLKVVEQYLGNTGTVFAIDVIHGKDISAFSTLPEEQEIVLMPGTLVSAKCLPLIFENRFFLIHLTEESEKSESQPELKYLAELIKQKYQQNNRIERFMNPSKSFPIEQSYINLSIIETKEQLKKEKKLLNQKPSKAIIGAYEEIYGMMTKIEIKNIFETCKDQRKNIIVLGRAGIGKTTFCQYAVHQWATSAIWQQYDLVIRIPLRNLTDRRYPPLTSGIKYSLIDLVKTEYFYSDLSAKYEVLLSEQFNKAHVLWLLDGYDEIVQSIPPHLQYLLEQLLKTSNHILTSRPYMNTLSYNVQLEITGFTNENINQYIQQFFDQIKNEIDNSSIQAQKLFRFLKHNPRIWGIVHIPVNLELICSVWCNTDWAETTTITMTSVYDQMIEWLCRRYLTRQNNIISPMRKNTVFNRCDKELAFLETLAFIGMEENTVMLRPKLLVKAERQTELSLDDYPHFLNLGVLKSFDDRPIGTCTEADKNHYFVHLSFQEHFAARYLANALHGNADQKKKATDFIKTNKYNQRFELVISFASGLLTDSNNEHCINLFWDTLLGEPLDLIGLRHVQIIISCLEEASCSTIIPQYSALMNSITAWISDSIRISENPFYNSLLASLQRSPFIVNQSKICNTLLTLHSSQNTEIQTKAYLYMTQLPIYPSSFTVMRLHLTVLNCLSTRDTIKACHGLAQMGQKVATDEVIHQLANLLANTHDDVKISALEAIEKMGEKAATNEVIHQLITLLDNTNDEVKRSTLEVIVKMGTEIATDEVIHQLITLLVNTNDEMKISALKVIEKMGEKAATDEVIHQLITLLANTNDNVKISTLKVIEKMGEKAATDEVIHRLIILLANTNDSIKRSTLEVTTKIGKRAATRKMIHQLINLLANTKDWVKINGLKAIGKKSEKAATEDEIYRMATPLANTKDWVKISALKVFEKIGEKAATDEVIHQLTNLLANTNDSVKIGTLKVIEKISEKAATDEVIHQLATLLDNTNDEVKISALEVTAKIGEKVATGKMIHQLITLLANTNDRVKRSALEVIVKMGTETATDEVIHQLITLLANTNNEVKISALEVIEKMGEKAATDEVIHRLIILLANTNGEMKISALEVTTKIGKRAATRKMIHQLITLLANTKDWVKINGLKAIGKKSEKAANEDEIYQMAIPLANTKDWVKISALKVFVKKSEKAAAEEKIHRMATPLVNTNDMVKISVLKVIEKMGEKAATNEVIHQLITLLANKNDTVKIGTLKVIKKIGEKAATAEVIHQLANLLANTNDEIKISALEVIEKIGEKAASNEVINILCILLADTNADVKRKARNALVRMGLPTANDKHLERLFILLSDSNKDVRSDARKAMIKMGERAVSKEAINGFLTLLADNSADIRSDVCEVLEEIGEKVATNEVIDRLANLITDNELTVRKSACKVLEKIGEKAATENVIGGLLVCLSERDDEFKIYACQALGRMGERAATKVVIGTMLPLLCASNVNVISAAYQALENMGEKVAISVLIQKVLPLIWGWNGNVISAACIALKQMVVKAATEDTLVVLLNVHNIMDVKAQSLVSIFIEKVFNLLPRLEDLKEDTVEKLSSYILDRDKALLKKTSAEKLIRAFLDTNISFWLPIIRNVCIIQGCAITITETTIEVHGSKGTIEFPLPDNKHHQQLKEYFVKYLDKSIHPQE